MKKERISTTYQGADYKVVIHSTKNPVLISFLSGFFLFWTAMGIFVIMSVKGQLQLSEINPFVLTFISVMWIIGEIGSFQGAVWNAFGREEVVISQGKMTVRYYFWSYPKKMTFSLGGISNMRVDTTRSTFETLREYTDAGSGRHSSPPPGVSARENSYRGIIAFDYGGKEKRIGVQLEITEGEKLLELLKRRLPGSAFLLDDKSSTESKEVFHDTSFYRDETEQSRVSFENTGFGETITIKQQKDRFTIGFFLVWLSMWTFGGVMAIRGLIIHFTEPSNPQFEGSGTLQFMFVWLAAWLIGEIVAVFVLLNQFTGKEIILLGSGELIVEKGNALFKKTKKYNMHVIKKLDTSVQRTAKYGNPASTDAIFFEYEGKEESCAKLFDAKVIENVYEKINRYL